MEMTWYGLGCFRLAERGFPSVVMDPFDPDEAGLRPRDLQAPLVTTSRLVEDVRTLTWSQVGGVTRSVAGPGEYEIGGVFINGVASHPVGEENREHVIYTVTYHSTTVCHLGELDRPPTQSLVEAIGPVTVLLIPVGIPDGLTPAMAAETLRLIEPAIVVPMQYDVPGLLVARNSLEGFLKELGVSDPTCLGSLRVSDGAEPEEAQIVVLEPQ